MKEPAWKKPQQKKKSKKTGKVKPKQKPKSKETPAAEKKTADSEEIDSTSKPSSKKNAGSGSDSDAEHSISEESGSEVGAGTTQDKAGTTSFNSEQEEDEEQEWARFQNKLNKREKALEGKSRISHSVHCPYFTDDKQEHWWVYICDRKTHSLITPPYHLTNLVNNEEVELKFTAPGKPGHYNFTVCVRSDSYLGVDLMDDIRLDVQEAREAPTAHPQWKFEDESGDDEGKEASAESEYATDDDYEDESD